MDRFGGIIFSLIFSLMFMLVGWAFAPFDTQPVGALVIASIFSMLGLGAATYFWLRSEP